MKQQLIKTLWQKQSIKQCLQTNTEDFTKRAGFFRTTSACNFFIYVKAIIFDNNSHYDAFQIMSITTQKYAI